MKKALALLMILLAFFLAACEASRVPADEQGSSDYPHNEITIGVSVPVISEDYWKADIQGIQEQADILGINVKIMSSQQNPDYQAKQIENLISQGVDAIILSAVDVYTVMSSVKKCNEAGIPVIYNSRILEDSDEAHVDYGVGYDPSELAVLGAEWLAAYAQRTGLTLDVLELYGAKTDSHTRFCRKGFQSIYDKYPDVFANVTGIDGQWKPDIASAVTSEALSERKTINCIIMHSDAYMASVQSALIAAERYYPRGQEGHVLIAAIGGEASTLDAISEGYADVLMVTPIYETAKLSVEYAYDIILGETPKGKEHIIPGFIVDSVNFNTQAYNVFGYLGKK